MITALFFVLSLSSASALPPTPPAEVSGVEEISDLFGQAPVEAAYTCGQASGAGCSIPCNDGSTVSCPAGYSGVWSFCTTFFVTCNRAFLTCPDF